MTPEQDAQPPKRLPSIETGKGRVRVRAKWASHEWNGLRIDYEHALDQLETARREDVIQLHPAQNIEQAEAAVRRAAIAIIESSDAKHCDMPTLVRLAAIAAGRHDPASLNPETHDYGPADAALFSIYRQSIRLQRD